MKRIAILGSTGSIGTQALDVAALHPELFQITALCAHGNKEKLFEQVRLFRPQMAGLVMPLKADEIPPDLRFCKWIFGQDMLKTLASQADCDAVLISVVGIAGLEAVLAALQSGKQVLLANKEALVAGGQLVMDEAHKAQLPLLPVDSEHSAIFQCLQGAGDNKPEKIILTASGGPFRLYSKEQIQTATLSEALRHPNWAMGKKITIDSATMFNKGLEMVEAKWLFDLEPHQIEVLVHPQSIVHSAVVFQDGAVIAQMGLPDMRVPILYAMAYPKRLQTGINPPDFSKLHTLDFEPGDSERFPALRIARECMDAGGAAACQMNGANEVAVAALLDGQIPFSSITPIVEQTLASMGTLPADTLEQILYADRTARRISRALLSGGSQ